MSIQKQLDAKKPMDRWMTKEQVEEYLKIHKEEIENYMGISQNEKQHKKVFNSPVLVSIRSGVIYYGEAASIGEIYTLDGSYITLTNARKIYTYNDLFELASNPILRDQMSMSPAVSDLTLKNWEEIISLDPEFKSSNSVAKRITPDNLFEVA